MLAEVALLLGLLASATDSAPRRDAPPSEVETFACTDIDFQTGKPRHSAIGDLCCKFCEDEFDTEYIVGHVGQSSPVKLLCCPGINITTGERVPQQPFPAPHTLCMSRPFVLCRPR